MPWITILSYLGLFLITVLGIVAHFLKKQIKGQTKDDIRQYFLTHFKDTLLTVIAAVILFVMMIVSGEGGIYAAFACGYIPDSLFNRSKNTE